MTHSHVGLHTRLSWRARLPAPARACHVLAAVVVLAVAACGEPTDDPQAAVAGLASACEGGAAVETDGLRRLALVVGVGQYQNDKVPDLAGAPNDARRIYQLLTDDYGFPRENVCLLLDEAATTARFLAAFEQGLIGRARASDVAVVYFAGHGSQAKDVNGDEPDAWDETLMLHDARTGEQGDLVDDTFSELLARLHAGTKNIFLILDSCNSGTATRGDGTLVARFFEPAPAGDAAAPDAGAAGDGSGAFGAVDLSGLVTFTAAADGTPALERDGRGIFTDALIQALSAGGGRAPTYAQLARQIPPLVAATSYQVPYFQGNLQGTVFGAARSGGALAWEVVSTTPSLSLAGPPLPGLGAGAELRIFDGAALEAGGDPAAAKAVVVVTEMRGVNATARALSVPEGAAPIAAGDRAVLLRPSDAAVRLTVSPRKASAGGGVPVPRASALRSAVAAHPEARLLVDVVDRGGEMELSLAPDGRLVLRGPENRIRNVLDSDAAVVEALWQHARQRAVLKLRGEGGADFVDHETLRARLVPARRQPVCARGEWMQAEPNGEQIVPLCHDWNLEVTLAQSAPVPLLIGALILSTDGSLFGLPRDGRTVVLRPGETVRLDAPGETFRGSPPLDTRDQIMVFGTREGNPVPWYLMTRTANERATRGGGSLYRALDRYLTPGMRGAAPVAEGVVESTWTLTALSARVEANPRFLEPKAGSRTLGKREYTLPSFDVRPYLPDATETALHRVLAKASSLAKASATDGYGYRQHDWSKGSDAANLRTGIDCSRAIWFAFTRAGLPYNRGDRYLTTAMMVGADSPMAEEFERCPQNDPLRLGDILVYRSSTRNDGHVVMVIDEAKRIAWGSHGWDGEGRTPGIEPDTGVEYQRIKFKPDWTRWDRSDMTLRACWRYERFTAELDAGGVAGVAALASPCDERTCPR